MLEQGYHIINNLLDAEEVEVLRKGFCQLKNTGARPSSQVLYTHELPAEARPPFTDIATQYFNLFKRDIGAGLKPIYEKARGTLEDLGLEGYHLYQDSFIQKVKTSSPFPWHQDYPFWPVDRPEGWTLWTPLDEVHHGKGGVRLAVNSHREGIAPAIDLHTGAPQIASEELAFQPENYDVICPEMQAGDGLLFHGLLFHASDPNYTGLSRRVWTSVWLGPEVRWKVSRAPRHFISNKVEDGALVRGFWE